MKKEKKGRLSSRRKRSLRRVLIAAAAVALLCGSAAAAYDFYVRQSVPVDPDQTVQGIVGNGQPSWTQQVVDAPNGGKPRHYPNREVVRSDTALAEGLMRDACRETGCALLLVTHSLQQARRAADDALFLDRGRLVEKGQARQVLFRPDRPETKSFLDFYGG